MQPYIAMIVPMGTAPGQPDQGLPGGPNYPSQGLPGFPGHPGHPLPPGHGHPDQGLPSQLPELPPSTWPPQQPGGGGGGNRPSNPIELPPQIGNLPVYPESPGHPLPIPPGVVWPPLPPSAGTGKAIVLVAISGVGYRWTVIDLGASIGHPLPPGGDKPPVAPGTPGHPLPPTAQPKR